MLSSIHQWLTAQIQVDPESKSNSQSQRTNSFPTATRREVAEKRQDKREEKIPPTTIRPFAFYGEPRASPSAVVACKADRAGSPSPDLSSVAWAIDEASDANRTSFRC
ncbi:hypothetical protein ACJRO7_006597 [Eucalyptus globulus]|uniref:Uncharacterized protein n=1 Tax=Eucalyptus globulus TaxID=34317 RepID=A0ABD3IL15_EUCGL